MDQNEFVNQLKSALNEFPQFFKNFVRHPFTYIDQQTPFQWAQILLFTFLVEAIVNVVYNVAILNAAGIASSLIFFPVQTLVIIGLLSFVLSFIFEKMSFLQISFFMIFKLLCFVEMAVRIFVLPVAIFLYYFKNFESIYALLAFVVFARGYLAYRGFSRQFQLPNKKAMGVISIFVILFLVQPVSKFVEGFRANQEARQARHMHEQQMEKSIEEIEKDLGAKVDTD
jgi:hypothetical protein